MTRSVWKQHLAQIGIRCSKIESRLQADLNIIRFMLYATTHHWWVLFALWLLDGFHTFKGYDLIIIHTSEAQVAILSYEICAHRLWFDVLNCWAFGMVLSTYFPVSVQFQALVPQHGQNNAHNNNVLEHCGTVATSHGGCDVCRHFFHAYLMRIFACSWIAFAPHEVSIHA